MEIISFVIFNFFIIFGSLFYLFNLEPTFKKITLCFLLNTCIAIVAIQYDHLHWLPMTLCILFGGSLFYYFTKKQVVFLYVIGIHLAIILIEYIALLIVNLFQLPIIVHGVVILFVYIICLYFYKKISPPDFVQFSVSPKGHVQLLLLSIMTLIVFYLNVFIPSSNGELHVSTSNLAILLVYFILLFISSKNSLNTMYKETELKQRQAEQHYFYEYMNGLEEMNRQMRTIQHDYSNILLSLHGYIQNEDIKGLKSYFDTTILKMDRKQNEYFQQLENMDIIEIKGLMGAKLLKAQSLNIATQVEVPEKIQSVPIPLIDLTRIIGIFLDNAVEASVLHKNPQIHSAFLYTPNNDLVIVIRNTTNEQYLDINQLFEERYSIKGPTRGHGLFIVKQLLVHHPTITLNTYLENEWFTQEMIIER